jgi:hypothetical protein
MEGASRDEILNSVVDRAVPRAKQRIRAEITVVLRGNIADPAGLMPGCIAEVPENRISSRYRSYVELRLGSCEDSEEFPGYWLRKLSHRIYPELGVVS